MTESDMTVTLMCTLVNKSISLNSKWLNSKINTMKLTVNIVTLQSTHQLHGL